MRKTNSKIDTILPSGRWIFDEAVANCFDNMIQRSIPDYQNMRSLVFRIAKNFVQPSTSILDLGCSTGIALEPFIEEFYNKNTFYGVEVSKAMFSVLTTKFSREIKEKKIFFYNYDLSKKFPNVDSSVILSILTLQFINPNARLKILKSVYKSLHSNGCFIIVEKLTSPVLSLENCFTEIYYGMKKEHGYTDEQIKRKRLSLQGVMQPLSAYENEELLKKAGFKKVECFWRHLNFAGWICIKD